MGQAIGLHPRGVRLTLSELENSGETAMGSRPGGDGKQAADTDEALMLSMRWDISPDCRAERSH